MMASAEAFWSLNFCSCTEVGATVCKGTKWNKEQDFFIMFVILLEYLLQGHLKF